jgi:hypothetical protein
MTRNRDKYALRKGDRGKYAFVDIPYLRKSVFFLSYTPGFNGQYCLVKYTEKKN